MDLNTDNDRATLRVSTLNLDHFPDDRIERLHAAAAAIRRHRSDVALLQEVTPIDGVDSAERLAGLLGFDVAARSEHGNAVITRLRHRDGQTVGLGEHDAAAAYIETGCHTFVVASTHLYWGSGREHERLTEAMLLDRWFSERSPLDPQRGGPEVYGIIGGDLNSEPDMATLRWLKGLDVYDETSTLWVDAWICGNGPGWTSTPENPYTARTALANGIIHPQRLPHRRIDHILCRGYAHGRVGAPEHAELIGRGASRAFGDHYGIGVQITC